MTSPPPRLFSIAARLSSNSPSSSSCSARRRPPVRQQLRQLLVSPPSSPPCHRLPVVAAPLPGLSRPSSRREGAEGRMQQRAASTQNSLAAPSPPLSSHRVASLVRRQQPRQLLVSAPAPPLRRALGFPVVAALLASRLLAIRDRGKGACDSAPQVRSPIRPTFTIIIAVISAPSLPHQPIVATAPSATWPAPLTPTSFLTALVLRTLARSLSSNAEWQREHASRASSLLVCWLLLHPPTASLPLVFPLLSLPPSSPL